ncbi:MAG: sensor histidine kinase [Gemmatimonadales bacterium]
MKSPRGIRLRLTAWYGGSVLLALLAVTLGIHEMIHRVLERESRLSLRHDLTFVSNLYSLESPEFGTVDSTVAHIAQEIVFPDRTVEFFRPDGTPFPAPPQPSAGSQSLEPPLRAREAPLDSLAAPGWRIRITASEAGLARSLNRLDLSIVGGVVVSVALATLLGWWLAGQTLAPVGAMAEAAEAITAQRPGDRLPVANPHDELGRLGRRFNALLDRLDGALAQQRRFLADAAHELRTPIARMMTNVEAALTAGDAGTQQEALAHTQADLARTAVLVDELLQLAHADAGQREIRREHVFLDDLVLDSASAWRAAAQRQGIRLAIGDIEETPATADSLLTRRLIDILLDNAIRYTPRGGTVTVRVHPREGQAILEVEDTGIGIPDTERARVFERFYRGRTARQMAPEGSGLGLPIAEWIVQRHGGNLALAPVEPRGTRVTVALAHDGNGRAAPTPGITPA